MENKTAMEKWIQIPIKLTQKRRKTARNAFNTAREKAIAESGLSSESKDKFLRR